MLKINNNSILKGLSFLGVIVLSIMALSPVEAKAYVTSGGYQITEGGSNVNYVPINQPSTASTDTCKNQTPKITSISPSSVKINSGERTVRISGTCFTNASVARFNSANRQTTFLSSKSLDMKLTANDTKAPGKFLITVQDPKGYSNSTPFSITSSSISKAKKSTSATVVKATSDQIECVTPATLASEEGDNNKESLLAAAIFGGDDLMPNSLLGWIFLFVFILLAVTLWRKIYVHDKERNAPLKHA